MKLSVLKTKNVPAHSQKSCISAKLKDHMKNLKWFGSVIVQQKGRTRSSEGRWVNANSGSNPKCDEKLNSVKFSCLTWLKPSPQPQILTLQRRAERVGLRPNSLRYILKSGLF